MLDNGVVEAATLEQSIGIGAKQPVLMTRDALALNSRRSSAFMPDHDVPPAAFAASFARVRLTKSLSRPFGSRRRYMPGHFSSGTMSGGKVLFFEVSGH
jgi:hypothetical protein